MMLRTTILAAATTLPVMVGSLTMTASPAAAWYANQPYIRLCHYYYWPYGYYGYHHHYGYGYYYDRHSHHSYGYYGRYGGPLVDCI